MIRTKIGELLVDVQSGFASGDDLETGGVLQVRMNNVETDGSWNWSARRMVPVTGKQLERCQLVDGDVLFNATNSPELVGKTALFSGASEAVVFSNHFLRLRTDVSSLAPAFLAHWLRAQWSLGTFRALCNAWVNQASVRKEVLLGLEIELPSLVEQQRIAAILDKADSLRRQRQDAVRLADEFLRSAYLDIAKEHPGRATVESVLAKLPNAARTGPFGSQLLVSEFTKIGIPVLGIDNVVSNSFTWGARRFVSPEKYAELERYTVRPGDVMVTIMGTTGRVAVAPDDLPLCISTKHLCTLSLDQQKMRSSYLWACLRWDSEVRAQTQRESKGAIMEGWNMGIVKGLMVSEPPLEVQLKFEALLTQIDKFSKSARKASDETDAMIASLSSKYLSSPTAVR